MDSFGYRILEYLFDKATYPDTIGINTLPVLKEIYNDLYDVSKTERELNVIIRDNVLRPLVDSKYAEFSNWQDLGVGKRGTNPEYMNTVNKSTIVNGVLLEAGYRYVSQRKKELAAAAPASDILKLEVCPFTNTKIIVKKNDTCFEYQLRFHSNIYSLRLALVDWGNRKELNDSNRWIFLGMFYNNEWPIEEGTLITPQLISQIKRLGEYPRNFQEKSDYFLLKSAGAGGLELKTIRYNDDNFYDAYAQDKGEFLRILEGLRVRKYITINSEAQQFRFEEKGLEVSQELSQVKSAQIIHRSNDNQQIKILLINTEEDKLEAERVNKFLLSYGFSVSTFGGLTGDTFDSTFNIEKSIERGEAHYIVFVKSQNCEKNPSYIRVQTKAEDFHRNTYPGFKYLYFVGIQDGPYHFPSGALDYEYSFFEFRITTNRTRLIRDLLDDMKRRVAVIEQNVKENTKKSDFSFPKIALSENDLFWLKESYKRFEDSNEQYWSNISPKYWDKFPKDYNPLKIHPAVLDNGSYITLYGIWLIEPNSQYLQGIVDCIKAIKQILMKNGVQGDIVSDDIVKLTALPQDVVLKSLKLLSRFGGFIQIRSQSAESISFSIESQNGLDNFNKFESLEVSFHIKYPNFPDDAKKPKNEEVARPKGNLNEEKKADAKNQNKTPVTIKDRELSPVMGVSELAKDVMEIIDQLPTEQDQMIGILGRWGRGKTVFLKELKKNLEAGTKIKYHIVEYRAWKYQETPASWAYLYELLAEKYYGKPSKLSISGYLDYWERLINLNLERNGLTPILKFVGSLILSATTAIGLFTWNNVSAWIGIPIITAAWFAFLRKTVHEYGHSANDLIKKYRIKHDFKSSMGLQAEIQKEMIKLFNTWIPKGKQNEKVVLIVEDIDRCSEDKIMQSIDSLRVMLEDPEIINRLIIIAAIDDKILKNALKNKFKKLINGIKNAGLNKLVTEHIDKIFLLAIKLGTLTMKNKEQFIEELLKGQVEEVSDTGTVNNVNDRQDQPNADPNKGGKVGADFVIADQPTVQGTHTGEKEKNQETETAQSPSKINADSSGVKTETFNAQELFKKLTVDESKLLKQIMSRWQGATPRKMRIFYYRYLLCKLLLFNIYSDSGRTNIWQTSEGTEYLLNLMLAYIKLNNPDIICKDKRDIERNNHGPIDLKRITVGHTIEKEDCLNLYEVLEFVIAY